jgi:hypothetical protein
MWTIKGRDGFMSKSTVSVAQNGTCPAIFRDLKFQDRSGTGDAPNMFPEQLPIGSLLLRGKWGHRIEQGDMELVLRVIIYLKPEHLCKAGLEEISVSSYPQHQPQSFADCMPSRN